MYKLISVASVVLKLCIKPRIFEQFFSSTPLFWVPFEHPFNEPNEHLLVLAMYMIEYIVEIEVRRGLAFAGFYTSNQRYPVKLSMFTLTSSFVK